MTNIFIKNIPLEINSQDLRQLFTRFGTVTKANIITDQFSGYSRGYGFVEMPNEKQALEAIESLNDTVISGQTIIVIKSQPKEARLQ